MSAMKHASVNATNALMEYTVHGMWRWGIQSIEWKETGGGGLICDSCAHGFLTSLHHPV
jgi:hypothetical protein